MLDTTYLFDGSMNANGTANGVAITVTRDSTNVLDFLAIRDLGADAKLGIFVDVITGGTGSTSLQIKAQGAATAGGTYYDMLDSPVYPVAQLIPGAPIFRYGFPLNQELNSTAGVLAAPARFWKLTYTVVGTDSTLVVFSGVRPINDRKQLFFPAANYSVTIPAGEI